MVGTSNQSVPVAWPLKLGYLRDDGITIAHIYNVLNVAHMVFGIDKYLSEIEIR